MKKRILVVSSANMDLVLNMKRVPSAGETVIDSGKYGYVPGGKGANAAVAVSRLAPNAVHFHTKDFYKTKFGEENVRGGGFGTRGCNVLLGSVIGEGDIPTRQCIAILKKAGYDGFVSIEYEGADDCIEALAKGLTNLKSYIEE